MSLFPKSLFVRLTLLITIAVVIVVIALAMVFRQDRATLVARNFTDEKLAQIEALRDSLAKAPDDRPGTINSIAKQYGVLIVPVEKRPDIGRLPGPAFKQIVLKLQETLGQDTEIRWGTRLDQAIVWIRLPIATSPAAIAAMNATAGDSAPTATAERPRQVWSGLPLKNTDAGELPLRLAAVLGGITLVLLLGTFWFTRRLTQPLSELSKAVEVVAEGRRPEPLPEDGPSEIAAVSKSVNKMAANLAKLETDRKTMLAAISHDIRTPLTRLRLASEMSIADQSARQHIAADIDDIDRIVTQFLDFARGEPSEAPIQMRVDEALTHVAQKAALLGQSVQIDCNETSAAHAALIALYPAAFERMLLNLIENAHRYGKPPVELSAALVDDRIEIAVIDHGDGVSPADAERLKQPFVRGDSARGGTMGAGLGLAIVERLAAWHQGRFEIMRRPGGGNAAIVSLPIVPGSSQS